MTDLSPIDRSPTIAPRRRYLPAVDRDPYAIWTDEPVARALQRITTSEFTVAIDAIDNPTGDLDDPIATASAALGRIAALLRLVRPSIGIETCRSELQVLREARGFLDGLVAGEAEIRALDDIRVRFDAALRPDVFSLLRDRLIERRQMLWLDELPMLQQGGMLPHWLQQLRRARARFGAWPVEQAMHGQDPVADSFAVFADGLARSYRNGARRADGGSRRKWQRNARDLSHQVELLSSASPEMLGGTAATAASLADALAEQRRLRALQDVVAGNGHAPLAIDEVTAAVVDSLCEHEGRELQSVAAVLATRLYAETPDDFVARVERYWSTRG